MTEKHKPFPPDHLTVITWTSDLVALEGYAGREALTMWVDTYRNKPNTPDNVKKMLPIVDIYLQMTANGSKFDQAMLNTPIKDWKQRPSSS